MNYQFTSEERRDIIALMNREIVPAIGCTEPTMVTFSPAFASRSSPQLCVLDCIIDKILS